MRGRGLSRVHPSVRRRRRLWLAWGALAAMVLAVLATWWGGRPVVETVLQAWLPGVLGGETRLEVAEVSRTGAELRRLEHRRDSGEGEATDIRLRYGLGALRAGRVDEVSVAELRWKQFPSEEPADLRLPTLEWPVDRLTVARGNLEWPGVPGGIGFSAEALRQGEEVEVTGTGDWQGATARVSGRWQPGVGRLNLRAEGELPPKIGELLPGGAGALPVRPGKGGTWSVAAEWGQAGPERWGAMLNLPTLEVALPAGRGVVPVREVGVALQGEGLEPRRLVAGGRAGALALTEGVSLEVGPWLVEGPWVGPWRWEAGPGLLEDGAGTGRIAWQARGRVEWPWALIEGKDKARAQQVQAEVALTEPWRWGAVRGGPVAARVAVSATGGNLQAGDLTLAVPVPLRLGGLELDWELDEAGNPVHLGGSAAVVWGADAPGLREWEGDPTTVTLAADLADGQIELVAQQESAAFVWVDGPAAVTGEVAGSAWLFGRWPLDAGAGGWKGEGTLAWSRGDAAWEGWRASGVTAELAGRWADLVAPPGGAVAWGAQPLAGIAAWRGWWEAVEMVGQGVLTVARLDGPAEMPLAAEGLTVSLAREGGEEPSLEVRMEGARWADWRVGESRASLRWAEGRPVVAAAARWLPMGWNVRAVAEALAEGGWRWVAELGLVDQSERWDWCPELVPAMRDWQWRGTLSGTVTGLYGEAGVSGVAGAMRLSADFLLGSGDDEVRVTGLEADVAGSLEPAGVATAGPQTLRVQRISSGDLVLRDVLLEWALPGDGRVELLKGEADWLGGRVEVEPATWSEGEGVELTVRLRGVSLAEVARLWPSGPVRAAGTADGWLQVRWSGGRLSVDEGELRLRREGAPRLEVRQPGWLTARAAPRSREYVALETVERAAETMALEDLVIRLHDPERPASPIWLRMAGRTLVPDIEAPITLEVNLDLPLNTLLNSSLWRQIEW